jgi:putative membrane protein
MTYLVIKALHIIFVTTWFAGLFYIFRLFVYHAEAARKTEPARSVLTNQFVTMEKRLMYAITWPSAILTVILGPWMLIINPALMTQPWMYLKIFFVVLLLMYQFYAQRMISKLALTPANVSPFRMRMWNEVATVLLFAIVFLVILRDQLTWTWGVAGILGIAAILIIAIVSYNNKGKLPNQ